MALILSKGRAGCRVSVKKWHGRPARESRAGCACHWKNVEARMCSPLHIRASIKVAVITRQPRSIRYESVATVLIANLVGVNRRPGTAGDCANDRAFLATNQPAENRTTGCAPRSGDLIPMFFPD